MVEIDLASVVLNPKSHRIRSQIESHAERDTIARDPFGPRAQEVIAQVLRETERFDQLKSDLKDFGQRDPGVVTHTGLLVNANTRCVALRDLHGSYIRVAVLDEDASNTEIDRIELNLQMKRDLKRDYSFTNELLFIYELATVHRFQASEIAIEMGWMSKIEASRGKNAEDRISKHMRMHALIRNTQAKSENRIPLVLFDDMRQAITEIDDDYEKIVRTAPLDADNMRDTRLLALLSGAGYRELREIDGAFLEKYLAPSMDELELFKGRLERLMGLGDDGDGVDPAGLDVLGAPPASGRKATRLLDLLVKSTGQSILEIDDGHGTETIDRSAFVKQLNTAVVSAVEDARIDRQQGAIGDRPLVALRKASRYLRAAKESHEAATAVGGYSKTAFETALRALSLEASALLDLVKGS